MVDDESGGPLLTEDLSALNTIATSVHSSLSLNEIYNTGLDQVLGITAFDTIMAFLVDENTNEAVLQAHKGLTEDYARKAGRIPYPNGVTWKVINSGELTLIDDVQKDPDLALAVGAMGHRTLLIIPIKLGEKTIGIISFASRRVLELSSRDISLLNAIGSQIGTAIVQAYLYERSQKQAEELKALYEDLNRRNKDLEILNTITQAVHQSFDLEEVYKVALDMITALENIDMATVYLVEDGKEAIIQAYRNIPDDYIRRAGRIPYPKGITWKIINTGEIMNIEDAQMNTDIGPAGRDLGHHGMLGIPMTLEGKVMGVVWYFTYNERQFNKQEVDLLTSIGNQIAIAIAKAKMFKEMKQREEALRNSEERYRALYDNNPSMYFTVNTEGKVLSVNHFGAEQLGYSVKELVGQSVVNVFYEDDKDAVLEHLTACIQNPTQIANWEFRKVRKNGTVLWVKEVARTVQDTDGNTVVLIVCEDITERKRQEEQIRHWAMHDPLTNLPNRRVLEENLERVVSRSQHGHGSALLLVDLDNFKVVNDTLGHLAGDQLLITLAHFLRKTLRQCDFLARFGGDEFAVLLEDTSVQEVKTLAERLYQEVNEFHFHLSSYVFDFTTSIGISFIDGSLDAKAVLTLADSALYAAKDSGKNRIVLYLSDKDKQVNLVEASQWGTRIKEALREDRFLLMLQPVMKLGNGKVEHFEALVRMQDESGKILLPDAFISAAERFGLMLQIDQWMVESVLRTLRTRPDSRIFINLSGSSMRDDSLLGLIKSRIKESDISSGQLAFEVTETIAITDLVQVQYWMKQLKELGCLFALDDFGIGFSSFSYLSALPVDYVKIDRSFIRSMDTNLTNRAIVQALTTVAHALGKEVIAEGVENNTVAGILQKLGVEYGQGYLWGLPSTEIS